MRPGGSVTEIAVILSERKRVEESSHLSSTAGNLIRRSLGSPFRLPRDDSIFMLCQISDILIYLILFLNKITLARLIMILVE